MYFRDYGLISPLCRPLGKFSRKSRGRGMPSLPRGVAREARISRFRFADLRSYTCQGRGGGQPPDDRPRAGLVHTMTLWYVSAPAGPAPGPLSRAAILHPRPPRSRPLDSAGRLHACEECSSHLAAQWETFESEKLPHSDRSVQPG